MSAHISITVVKTKIELDSHADTCVLGDRGLIVNDCIRPVNVYGYHPKAGLKNSCVVNTAFAYTEPETNQVVVLSINQAVV